VEGKWCKEAMEGCERMRVKEGEGGEVSEDKIEKVYL
jgi:hypothetical protein